MRIKPFLVTLLVVLLMVAAPAQQKKPKAGSSARTTGKLIIVPDIAERVAKFREVRMPFHSEGMSPQEIKMVGKLVEACNYLEDIYWRQMDPDALNLYESLEGSKSRRTRISHGVICGLTRRDSICWMAINLLWARLQCRRAVVFIRMASPARRLSSS